ncbi:MAG TPA: phage tail sheath C-terminal domain-containing protein [Bacteroidia bacterium]|nr:phage tail sheath C-terminal domain-containing protein [Bacteroidia bacterium]
MTTYKTPDVYVEEISIFPPSVAEVETAIPAFIGYTEIADNAGTSLLMKPTRISSLLEYRTYFGGGPSPDITEVKLNDDNTFKSVTQNADYYMFDSLQLFYANGGGDCYIVSVGLYGDTIITGDDTIDPPTGILGGLKVVEKFDEPTILLFPDAVNISGDDLYSKIQPAALAQCNKLMDRVAVFDLHEDDPKGTTFRDKVGINYLKYGMAYTPWLDVNLGKTIMYRDLLDSSTYASKLKKTGVVPLAALTNSTDIQALITNLESAIKDVDTVASDVSTNLLSSGTFDSVRSHYESLKGDYNAATDDAGHEAKLKLLIKFLYDVAVQVDDWTDSSTGLLYSKNRDDISTAIDSILRGSYSKLRSYEKELHDDVAGYTAASPSSTPANVSWQTDPLDALTNIFTATPASLGVVSGTTDFDKVDSVFKLIDDRFEEISAAFNTILNGVSAYETSLDKSLNDSFPTYKNIISGIGSSFTSMPPSGAIAGVYAETDRDRGVWKAPANVSLSSVVGPATTFTASELDALNIDVNAGKSINAIRAFTGKGTLVWGARTLAGNDNEWRYIPVRRFFNMVEESVKKSTYWAVFEPNSANTWVKVKGMIENYLTLKWKDGALAGAKPDEAFFVKIGLGTTMTAQDILEGRMNVEIGMAVVRPAEFIILKFSHLLQQS